MARLNKQTSSSDVDVAETSSTSERRAEIVSSTPPSDFESIGSDKENRNASKSTTKHIGKRNSASAPMSEQYDTPEGSRNKRQKLDHRPRPQQSQAAHRRELQERVDTTYYDPDQNEVERRATKKSLRDLVSRVNDSRAEFLQPGSKGIEDTLAKADEIYKNVKQTSVATIDSRLLVTVGDLAYKKVNTLTLGDSSTGVDVDDFVSQCIRFMNEGSQSSDLPNGTQPSSSQARSRGRPPANDDEDEDDAEPMNWAHLGKHACFLYNNRPCLSGFLLGPLSVQKKVRQQTQRRAREARADPSQAARPLELGAEDLKKEESANLTVICREIAKVLARFTERATQKVEEEAELLGDEPTEEEALQLFAKHGIADNGCVPLFNFCVNPKSFGQTVENMFYVSFLIKEGKVGLDFDSNGLPTIGTAEQKTMAERQEAQRHQAIFTLDFDIWKELVDAYGIQKSIIPHRKEEQWDDGTVQQITDTVRANDVDDNEDF